MKRIISLIDLEDVAVALGMGLLCGGLAMVYLPAGLMLAGLVILGPRLIKYLPYLKGRNQK